MSYTTMKQYDLKRIGQLKEAYESKRGKFWNHVKRLHNCTDRETEERLREVHNALAERHDQPLIQETSCQSKS